MMNLIIFPAKCAMYLCAIFLSLVSCDDGALDVQQSYDFRLETMPVPKSVVEGETVEIRCTLNRAGRFEDATYTIRYFQPDGKGELKMDDGTLFRPNDRYPLTKEVFRLYYTSNSTDQQTIDVYIEDNAGTVVMLTFSFNNEDVEDADNKLFL